MLYVFCLGLKLLGKYFGCTLLIFFELLVSTFNLSMGRLSLLFTIGLLLLDL